MKSKLPCLFGFHTFDETWIIPNGTFYGENSFRVCSGCRKCICIALNDAFTVDFGYRILNIEAETPEHFLIHRIFFIKGANFTIVTCESESFQLAFSLRAKA